jgi:8-oxo-dGTP pyrophosphatase MutT (NUDIX family)
VIDDAILTAIAARLAVLLAPPRGRFCPLRVDDFAAGWLDDARAERLAGFPDVFRVAAGEVTFVPSLADPASRMEALDAVARALAADGLLTRWRDERYAVAPSFGGPPSFLLERAAARYFGIRTYAVHVNGHTARDGGDRLWIARRSDRKPIDPGMLDNLVGGGVAAGLGVRETLIKESFEEAGIDRELASSARAAGEIAICREQPDGLQIETVFAHDLALPLRFVPRGEDGEVAAWRLMDVDEVAHVLAASQGPDVMTADASLVTVDWLLRRGHVAPGSPARAALAALLRAPASPLGAVR